MEREELQDRYEAGELDDPVELQRLRDDIYEYTGLQVPRSVAEIEDWWPDYKAIFARRIKSSDQLVEMIDQEQMTESEDEEPTQTATSEETQEEGENE